MLSHLPQKYVRCRAVKFKAAVFGGVVITCHDYPAVVAKINAVVADGDHHVLTGQYFVRGTFLAPGDGYIGLCDHSIAYIFRRCCSPLAQK